MKKIYWIIMAVIILIVLFIMVFRPGGEDSWIKDERGIWIKHGYPSETPPKVQEQQALIKQAKVLFSEYGGNKENGPCLGIIEDYAVDIAHLPRQETDNLLENQCQEYIQGKVNKFIELNEQGEIIKIKD